MNKCININSYKYMNFVLHLFNRTVLFLTASSFYSIFTHVSKTLNSAGALQEVSWASRRRWHSSSGSSRSRFVLFLHLSSQTDDDDDQISVWSNQTYHWIITINVWKYNTTQQTMNWIWNWIESFVLVGTRVVLLPVTGGVSGWVCG